MNSFRKPLSSLLFVLVLLGLFGASAPAAAQAAKAEKVVTIEGITEYRFPNGLRYLSFPEPASSTITINMTVLVGSRMEGYGETGMAHLLEHMLFKGSKNFPFIDKAMQEHGAAGHFNGTTSDDRTNYYETMPATDANLEFGIKLEADRLVNSFIKREDLVSEMTVVRNEFEMNENSPETILNQRVVAVAYEWHNYGKSTIGNRADIERVPIENLHAFYKKYYQPDNVVLVVTGKFDEAKALDYVARYFGSLPRPERKLAQTYTEEPAQDGERSVVLRRVGKVAVVEAVYHVPAATHADYPAVDVLGMILGNTPSGRLYKALVESKKATKVSGGAYDQHDPGLMHLSATVADQVPPEEVRDIMTSIAEKFANTPATKEEVERAIRQYESGIEQALTDSQRMAYLLSEASALGDWRILFVNRDRVKKVTPEDVTRMAAKYLRQTNRTTGMFIPSAQVARTPIPESPNVVEVVKDYKGGDALAKGEQFDPTPQNLEKRIVRKTLSSGLKVAFLPKKTRGESLTGSLSLHFGNTNSLQNYVTASDFVGPMMLRGTQKRTRQDIRDKLDELKSKLHVSSSLGQVSVSLESKRPQLPALLELLREVLREPTFPPDEFAIMQQNQKQNLQKALVEPQPLAVNLLRRELRPYPKGDIRYIPTIEESMARTEKVNRDEVARLYAEQLGGAHGELAIVGDVDIEATTAHLEKIFAGWKSKVAYERVKSELFQTKGGTHTINTPDKENAVYVAGEMFGMRDTDADYAALELGNNVLGHGFTSRLIDRLRQKEGLSYGAGSRLNISSEDPVSSFMAFAIANPTNMPKVEKGAGEEIANIIKRGVTGEELEAAKKGYLEEMKTERGSDSGIASTMRENLYLDRTFTYYADLEKKVAALTVDEVNRALSKYLSPERLIVIKAGDFQKK